MTHWPQSLFYYATIECPEQEVESRVVVFFDDEKKNWGWHVYRKDNGKIHASSQYGERFETAEEAFQDFKKTMISNWSFTHGEGLVGELTVRNVMSKDVIEEARKFSGIPDEDLVAICPECGKEQPDMDGFGVYHCEDCGFCIHPAVDYENGIGTCGICKQIITEGEDG